MQNGSGFSLMIMMLGKVVLLLGDICVVLLMLLVLPLLKVRDICQNFFSECK